jgi:hypothetical protein
MIAITEKIDENKNYTSVPLLSDSIFRKNEKSHKIIN